MHSCIVLQMGLVFPYLQWREAWKNSNGSFGCKIDSMFLVAWGFKKLTEVSQFLYSKLCFLVYKELSILGDEMGLL